MKQTIAEKVAARAEDPRPAVGFRLWPWVLCALLGGLVYFLLFCVPGYRFSALVCCGVIGLILFYEITRLLRYRVNVRPIRTFVTLCLIVGLLLFGATEAMIIRSSLGSPQENPQYVVVLGAKVRTTGPSASLWDRIYGARNYLQAHPDAIAIVSGGQGEDEPMSEALAMYLELVDLGIDESRIWIEDRATSTWENISFSLDLIEEKTGTRPGELGVVSSEYHLFRAGLLAKECGVERYVGIPARTSRWGQLVNHFMREVAGVWHYLILGGSYE